MTLAMKITLSAVIAVLVAVLVLWRGSPLHADMAGYLVALALAAVAVMWTFPPVRL